MKIKALKPEILNRVHQKYPVYKEIIGIVSDFRALFRNKCSEKLDD